MKGKKSRLALMGVLTLALALTVGLASGSVADAKKKKSGKSFTVSNTTPTIVPAAPSPTGEAFIKMPIGSVGGKATKGKVISLNGVNVTTTFSGPAGFADNGIFVTLQGPGGRQAGLANPIPNAIGPGNSNNETVSGPLTPPPPPCTDPDNVLGPPYAGTVGNQGLLNFSGSNPRGTWVVKVENDGAEAVTLNAISVTGGLITKPQ
jgi:hypothetical protein